MRLTCVLAVLAGCGRLAFDPVGDDGPTQPAHLVERTEPGTADLTIGASIVVDTTVDTFPTTLPPGATYEFAAQMEGPSVGLLRVQQLTVSPGARIRVIGPLPLVIVTESIDLGGVIDAGARDIEPGAGGAAPGAGAGAGANAVAINFGEGGGGGGGFGTAGSRGGDSTEPVPGAVGGAAYGEPEQIGLLGGSGGGAGKEPPLCVPQTGGAGGGAIQLFATGTITIGPAGGIQVGGGGGAGGVTCMTNAGSGGAGGAGGAVFVEARAITHAGVIAANGGAGGSGGANTFPGVAGEDGGLTEAAAHPGTEVFDGGVMPLGCAGGFGGHLGEQPTTGDDTCINAGGGGGAFGRIFIAGTLSGLGTISPAASLVSR